MLYCEAMKTTNNTAAAARSNLRSLMRKAVYGVEHARQHAAEIQAACEDLLLALEGEHGGDYSIPRIYTEARALAVQLAG